MNYKQFWHCFSCKKDLDEAFAKAHRALGHNVEVYKSIPQDLPKHTVPDKEKKDLEVYAADVTRTYEDEPEEEWEG